MRIKRINQCFGVGKGLKKRLKIIWVMDKKEMHNEEIDFNYVGVYQNSITHFFIMPE